MFLKFFHKIVQNFFHGIGLIFLKILKLIFDLSSLIKASLLFFIFFLQKFFLRKNISKIFQELNSSKNSFSKIFSKKETQYLRQFEFNKIFFFEKFFFSKDSCDFKEFMKTFENYKSASIIEKNELEILLFFDIKNLFETIEEKIEKLETQKDIDFEIYQMLNFEILIQMLLGIFAIFELLKDEISSYIPCSIFNFYDILLVENLFQGKEKTGASRILLEDFSPIQI